MDDMSRTYYEVVFERDFLKHKGTSFQDFFCEIMERCHPYDFQRVRPWGKLGDRKNDGYLKSSKILFQVYAPNEMKSSEAIDKIDNDFKGALPYWQEHFDHWVFAHNARYGLGPEVLKKLLELEQHYIYIKFGNWGYPELREKVFSLNDTDIASLFGLAPSYRDMHDIGFDDLKVVLEVIGDQEPIADQDLRAVPQDKLSANSLSKSVEVLLKAGMRKAHLVDKFFKCWHDPELGDRVASAFKNKYEALKKENISPDVIFMELQVFAGGAKKGTPKHQAAVLAVLAYLFEKCDIFERSRFEGIE